MIFEKIRAGEKQTIWMKQASLKKVELLLSNNAYLYQQKIYPPPPFQYRNSLLVSSHVLSTDS